MANLNKENIPKHVAIIMDGNGRWAIENSFKISEGHKKGVITVKDIVEESVKQDLSSLTIYAFSSENWKRPKTEVTAIKKLVVDAINDQVSDLKEQKVRLKFFGHIYDFGKKVIDKISYAEEETNIQNSKLDLNVALGYGGKQDIVDMAKKISSSVLAKQIKLKDITEEISCLGLYGPKSRDLLSKISQYDFTNESIKFGYGKNKSECFEIPESHKDFG